MKDMPNDVVGITGATGTIGKVVVGKLREKGYKLKTNRIDVGKLSDVKEFINGCDFIIHLAAEMDLSKGKDVFWQTNVNGVKNILECLDNKTKAVVVSSVVVYQDTGEKMRDESWKIKQKTTGNLYIDTKIEGLKLIRNSQTKVVTVMPSIVIDKSTLNKNIVPFNSKLLNFIWSFVGGGIPGGLMSAIGSKNRIINVVEINDIANGLVLAMEKGKAGEEYIMGGNNITVADYLRRMAGIMKRNYLKIRFPYFCVNIINTIIGKTLIYKPENMNLSSEKAIKNLGYKINWQI